MAASQWQIVRRSRDVEDILRFRPRFRVPSNCAEGAKREPIGTPKTASASLGQCTDPAAQQHAEKQIAA